MTFTFYITVTPVKLTGGQTSVLDFLKNWLTGENGYQIIHGNKLYNLLT